MTCRDLGGGDGILCVTCRDLGGEDEILNVTYRDLGGGGGGEMGF